ncbi:MAG: HD domain-containing protein, partial [Candidatus Micrarchaeota archaeon]
MKTIRDAVHNNIELNPLEISIIDTPGMQRLHYVRQLTLAYLVYPSALHTRFEHSLGTFHLTKLLSDRLLEDKEEKQLLRLAALLHDVGHSAFSHMPEELIEEKTGKDHELLGEEKILRGNIAEILIKNHISPRELLKAMKSSEAQIISSDLGTDRMDYLLRDAYFTGVAYSLIDAQRLLLSLVLKNGRLMVEEKGFLAAESLLVSRYLMFNAVYNHHAVRIAGEMLQKALRIAIEDEKLSVPALINGTDEIILHDLKGEPLIDRIYGRNLYKIAYEDPAFEAKNEKKQQKELETALSAELDYSDFVICMPKQPMGAISTEVLFDDGSAKNLASISTIAKAVSLERKASGIIIATDKRNAEKAGRICR